MPQLQHMRRSVRDKIVAALRSGEYAQTTGHLCKVFKEEEDKEALRFCCLGVATVLSTKDGVPLAEITVTYWNWDDDGNRYMSRLFNGEGSFPPARVREWLGVPLVETMAQQAWINAYEKTGYPYDVYFRTDGKVYGMAALNDDDKTFAEIADLLAMAEVSEG